MMMLAALVSTTALSFTPAGVQSIGAQPAGAVESTRIEFDIACSGIVGTDGCEDEVMIATLGNDEEQYPDTFAATISMQPPTGGSPTGDNFVSYVQRLDAADGVGWGQDLKLQYMVKPASWPGGIASVPNDSGTTADNFKTMCVRVRVRVRARAPLRAPLRASSPPSCECTRAYSHTLRPRAPASSQYRAV